MKTKDIAEDILRKARARSPWTPNTPEIMKAYGLKEQQARHVVRVTKRVAADTYGMIWGWDPVINGFRIVPSNAKRIAERVISYSFTHAADAVGQSEITVRGALAQGFITESDYDNAKSKTKVAKKLVIQANPKVKV